MSTWISPEEAGGFSLGAWGADGAIGANGADASVTAVLSPDVDVGAVGLNGGCWGYGASP